MSFISDIISPGARQAGDAAQTASDASKAITDKLLKLQDTLTGFVQNADQQGMFDPNRAAERFNQEWDRRHGQDMATSTAALGSLGYRPGDSEVDYRLQKEKGQLDQARSYGEEAARQDALQRKLAAYGSTNALLAPALAGTNQAGQFAVQGAQLNQGAMGNTFNNLTNLYKGISPFLRGRSGGGGGSNDPGNLFGVPGAG